MLVPSGGSASTVQGEVVRASGRIYREVFDNGGVNWGRDFSSMLRALVTHLGSGTSLTDGELGEARAITKVLAGGDGDAPELDRLTELSVRWVGLNPGPVPLPKQTYRI